MSKQQIVLTDFISRTLLDQAHDGIVLTDPNLPDNPLVYVNDAFVKMTGYPREDSLGKNCRFLQGNERDEENQASLNILQKATAELKPVLVSLKNYRKDGAEFRNELSVSPIFDDQHNLIYFLGIQKDVTLEYERNSARDNFVSLVSHQLKDYPGSILWSTETLMDNISLSEEERLTIENIRTTCQTMNETIQTLLNITRLQLGTFESDPEPTNIKDIVSETISTLQPKVQIKQLNVKYDAVSTETVIHIDHSILRLILDTLLTNAIKYTPNEGLITIGLKTVDSDKVELSVSDTGIGIPQSDQSKLFTMMYRASNVHDIEGTGLGLYSLKMAVEAINGQIRVESAEGKGSSFIVTLPVKGVSHEGNSHLQPSAPEM